METGYSDTHVTNLQECLAWLKGYAAQQNEADRALLQQALALAEAHYPADAQTHAGEPLLPHTVGAAQMVAQLDLLPEAVAATILSGMSKQGGDWQLQVAEQCGQTVCSLVQGIDQVQKLTHFARVDGLATPEERAAQAETMRKMLLAMVSDIRVVLIKLALRTRTMQYLGGCPDSPEKRSIAKETLDIFAPLANRLGVWQLKWQLEDLGFQIGRATKTPKNTAASPTCSTKNAPSGSTISTISSASSKPSWPNTASVITTWPAAPNTSTPSTARW